MSDTKTGGIRIVVNSEYLPERSDPTKSRFFYAYHITIHNEGSQPAKLQGRYWHITDAEGNDILQEKSLRQQTVMERLRFYQRMID